MLFLRGCPDATDTLKLSLDTQKLVKLNRKQDKPTYPGSIHPCQFHTNNAESLTLSNSKQIPIPVYNPTPAFLLTIQGRSTILEVGVLERNHERFLNFYPFYPPDEIQFFSKNQQLCKKESQK